MRQLVEEARRQGRLVGFVPTMGGLHEGHASLTRAAAEACDEVAVSIFVNPSQFGPGEDFDRYPRSAEADCRLLAEAEASWVFMPEVESIYPPGDATRVVVGGPAVRWEGEHRPGHFEGVATVVSRLLAMVPAQRAYFGAKDWQQTVVVRRMVRDLALPVEIVVCPTIREPDGLAMSSRNAYLSPDERRRATALSAGLAAAEAAWRAGSRAAAIEAELRRRLEAADVVVDYAALVDPESLEPLAADAVRGLPAIALVAGRVGSTRLLDNCMLE